MHRPQEDDEQGVLERRKRMERKMNREDIEIAKTAALWTLGIILFFVIFFCDGMRIREFDKMQEEFEITKAKIQSAEEFYNFRQKEQLLIDRIEVLRTQVDQLEPLLKKAKFKSKK